MDRSKIVAVLTGAIALLLGVGYLLMVQLLDFRGEMLPAPQSLADPSAVMTTLPLPPSPSFFPNSFFIAD
jgi:hypothetical protein